MIRTKEITTAAMLTALSLVYIWLMPTIDLGVWSFTPFSHLFIMLGTLVSPFIGVFTAIGTVGGFFLKGASPIVLLRAGSHLFFILSLVVMLKTIKLNNTKNVLFVCLVAAAVHAVFEVLAVYLGIWIAIPVSNQSVGFILGVVGGGTFAHSILDFLAGFAVYKMLKKSRII